MLPADLAITKLIILSIIDRVPGITLGQLRTLALETLYMDYFDFVTSFEEMIQDQMITESVRKNEKSRDAMGRPVSRCDLTPDGKTVYDTLKQRIPLPVRSYLAQVCSGWQRDLKLQNVLTARCDPDGNGFYTVQLKLNDGLKDLIDINLTLPEQQMGQIICQRWKRHPQTIYLNLLSLLTGESVPVPQAVSQIDQESEDKPDNQEPYPNQQTYLDKAGS